MVPASDLCNGVNVMEIKTSADVFGDGTHETTRMMIRAIDGLDLRGLSVLDIGTGTGILAIQAKLNGAEKVTAVDVDLAAILTARQNFERNGVEIVSRLNILNEHIEPHDVTLANIEPRLVREILGTLGGVLVCSFPHGRFKSECRKPLTRWDILAEITGTEWDVFTLRRKR